MQVNTACLPALVITTWEWDISVNPFNKRMIAKATGSFYATIYIVCHCARLGRKCDGFSDGTTQNKCAVFIQQKKKRKSSALNVSGNDRVKWLILKFDKKSLKQGCKGQWRQQVFQIHIMYNETLAFARVKIPFLHSPETLGLSEEEGLGFGPLLLNDMKRCWQNSSGSSLSKNVCIKTLKPSKSIS